jgi:hypothetical protein
MIQQLDPSMFFVTFTYVGRLWDPLIKALHTLNVSRLNLPNEIKYLQFFYIIEMIQIDPVRCVHDITIVEHFIFANLSQNFFFFFNIFLSFFHH